jgi:acetyl-CoA carboxylase beta subunit
MKNFLLGRDAMIYGISHKYYWIGMTRDVMAYIRSCHQCQQFSRKSAKNSLEAIKVQGNFEQWQLDLFSKHYFYKYYILNKN